jgi:hypothetical protein
MRVYAAVFALCIIAALLTSEPYCGSREDQETATVSWHSPTTAVGTEKNQTETHNKTETAHNRPPSWCTALKKSEWWLVIIAAFTGIAIALQAREMARATGVMKNQWTTMQGQLAEMEGAGKHTETLAAQAVKQSDLTQRQLDLANRPWVCLDSITAASDLVFKDSGEVFIFFKYQLRNVGHSVAQHLQPWIEPIIYGIDDPREVEERISAQLKKPIDSAFDHGKLIFPSQVLVDTYPVMVRKEVLENAIKNSPFKEGENRLPCFGLELFICFDYQSTLDAIHHQTQTMYALGYVDDGGRVMGAFYPSQHSYPVARLTTTYKGYGAYAD